MTMTITTEPLTRVQQLMLQRLMAAHCLDDKATKALLTEIHGLMSQTGTQDSPQSLEECFADINQQLTKGFGLEIATVVLDRQKYHSIINSHADEVSKLSFDKHFDAHDRQFILLIMKHLVENHPSVTGDKSSNGAPRKDLYNLRGDLQGPYKLTLNAAEHVVESLVQQQWLRITKNDDDDRRSSMQANLELAPRSYLELSHLLVDIGVSQDDLPQFLFHRL
ncbi:unnamed protein product [Cylindrotheca closterium]|uniref:Non-structural maintenance of chromosomes element 1 homolog n=1 Tax=Cylindrotheca closterium TaxID=2856 RepID=A0AAD2G5X8_9STRA|nr:unnamed protein product [Cylindrotheca closterium]